jgi:hypothetical protein
MTEQTIRIEQMGSSLASVLDIQQHRGVSRHVRTIHDSFSFGIWNLLWE